MTKNKDDCEDHYLNFISSSHNCIITRNRFNLQLFTGLNILGKHLRDAISLRKGNNPRYSLNAVVMLNTICNLRCSYCFIGADKNNFSKGYSNSGLALEDLKIVLRKIRKASHSVLFVGGEPFLREDFEEVLRYSKQDLKFFVVTAVTNGTFLKEKTACLRLLDVVDVSYDLMRHKQYPKIIEGVLEDIVYLKEKKVIKSHRLNFHCTYKIGESFQDWKSFLQFCHNYQFKVFLQPYREAGNNCNFNGWSEFNAFLQDVKCYFGEKIFYNTTTHLGKYDNQIKEKYCIPKSRLQIDVHGNLCYPCEVFSFQQVGNLLEEGDVQKLWDKALKKYGTYPNKSCRDCAHVAMFDLGASLRHPVEFLVTNYNKHKYIFK